ncbi:M20 family metallopeptidase [Pelagibius sp. Alg239-R121]|uniref:M20 family metallopeptidase n=1 Tax=Pelagibius sp. Alg239-R121 TaxID=2993448 RepID=UPI0024A70691|nr:M20 family metallopeptidase [Pelagibius sp. Alg239-R121]
MAEKAINPNAGCAGAFVPALERLSELQPEMLDDLSRLIATETSFPPGNGYPAFAQLAENLVSPLGFTCERINVPPELWSAPGAFGERTNVIAVRDSGKPKLAIYFHVDTVPPGDGWTHPPLELTRIGDRLFGRGTADMKGTIAAVLAALRALDAAGEELAYDPVLLFCTDEEGGLYPGVRYIAEQGKLSGHLLCLNGGAVPRIYGGSFGSMDFRLSFFGRSAHSGDPVGGINALEEALAVLTALTKLKSSVETRKSQIPSPPHLEDRPLHARLTLTAASAGSKGSALPGQFHLIVNRRYTPEENAEKVEEEIRNTVAQAVAGTRLLGHDITLTGHLAPVSDPTGPHGLRWQQALSEGFGWAMTDFRTYGSSTSSDLGWVQKTGQKEILLGGLSRPDRNVHAADEHTTLSDLMGLARAILFYLSAGFESDQINKE